jgi:hypothetical protein
MGVHGPARDLMRLVGALLALATLLDIFLETFIEWGFWLMLCVHLEVSRFLSTTHFFSRNCSASLKKYFSNFQWVILGLSALPNIALWR